MKKTVENFFLAGNRQLMTDNFYEIYAVGELYQKKKRKIGILVIILYQCIHSHSVNYKNLHKLGFTFKKLRMYLYFKIVIYITLHLENTLCDHLFLLRVRGFMVIDYFFLHCKWRMVHTYFSQLIAAIGFCLATSNFLIQL